MALGTGALRTTMDYIPVPESAGPSRTPAKHWRIVLIAHAPYAEPIGLEIRADVILGRAGKDANSSPDLDLSILNAEALGVSRRHVMLRPTPTQLFVMDLESTNGTHVNTVPLEVGMARALRHNDSLSLGDLTMTVKIMDQPGTRSL